ncbi:hypothetical protein [Salipaludibacillus daqingensis]|nr:hypothetical protein [Salipaludibacillus daqingensis]
MLKKFFKGLGIGLGIGLAIYAAGFAKDYKDQQEIARERETFGKGE